MWMSSSNRGSGQKKKRLQTWGWGVKNRERVPGTVHIPLPGKEILG
jgi:hypothetical protein